jgi:polysaccharide export outer membrane protein
MNKEKMPMPRLRRKRLTVLTLLLALWVVPCLHSGQDAQALPVNDYRIGAKDLLEITVFNVPELNQTVRVSEDGSVTLSLLGKVDVAGLTAQELEKRLASLLDQQYTKDARVTVFIKEYQKIAVIGAVGRPGMYEMVGPTTLLQAIAQAGGFTAQAMNELFVYRQEKDGRQTRISVKLEGGNPDLNIDLQPKDVIQIPIDKMLSVFVYGEVRKPGEILYLSSKKITLLQAIAQAGGPTEWAKKSRILIKRKDQETGNDIKIWANLKAIINGRVVDIILQERDVIIVR